MKRKKEKKEKERKRKEEKERERERERKKEKEKKRKERERREREKEGKGRVELPSGLAAMMVFATCLIVSRRISGVCHLVIDTMFLIKYTVSNATGYAPTISLKKEKKKKKKNFQNVPQSKVFWWSKKTCDGASPQSCSLELQSRH